MKRTLTITVGENWHDALRNAGGRAKSAFETGQYQGESLNFESPAAFFGQLTERRWNMLRVMMGNGTIGVRELARRLQRDVKRVHEDAQALVELARTFHQPSDPSVSQPLWLESFAAKTR